MCIILIFSLFSTSLLKTCTIPSIEYVLSIWPLRFSSRQWNAVKFSFMNILCNSSRPIDVLSIFFKPFLLPRAFLRVFYLQIVRLSFMRSFFDFPIRWQASISWLDSFTSILSKISIIFSQGSDPQRHLESLWFEGYSFDHIARRKNVFFQRDYFFFKVIYFMAVAFGFQPVNLL